MGHLHYAQGVPDWCYGFTRRSAFGGTIVLPFRFYFGSDIGLPRHSLAFDLDVHSCLLHIFVDAIKVPLVSIAPERYGMDDLISINTLRVSYARAKFSLFGKGKITNSLVHLQCESLGVFQ